MKIDWRSVAFFLGIVGGIQFLMLTSWAMWIYPGGTIHHAEYEQYNFVYNYFSDLGRTLTFKGESNHYSHLLFKTALTFSGLSLCLFFVALPGIFQRGVAKAFVSLAAVLGILAGLCYIGIGWVPYNEDYGGHTFFVRVGFLLFFNMSLFYTIAIFLEPRYPNHYAWAFALFMLILGLQIYIMLFGPRAWRSNDGLLLQAVAQKVVVYAEILCLLYQSYGAFQLHRNRDLRI